MTSAALSFCSVYGAMRLDAETAGFEDRITRQPSRTKSAATPGRAAGAAGVVGSLRVGPFEDDEPAVPGAVSDVVPAPMPGAVTTRLIFVPFSARLLYVNVKVEPRLSAIFWYAAW